MVLACRAAGAEPPVLRHDATGLWVEFALLTSADLGGSPQVAPQVSPQDALLVALNGAELSRQELQRALGLKDIQHFRVNHLWPALEAGLIEMTRPQTPTSRLQQYRLTAAGQARLATLEF